MLTYNSLNFYISTFDPDFFKNLSQDGIFKKVCEKSGYPCQQLADIVARGKLAQILCQRNQNEPLTTGVLDELKASKKSIQRDIDLLRTIRVLPSSIDQSNWINLLSESMKFFDDLPKNSFNKNTSAAMRGHPEWDAVLKSMCEYALESGVSSKTLLVSLVQFVDPSWDVDERDLRKSLDSKKMQQEQDACFKKFLQNL